MTSQTDTPTNTSLAWKTWPDWVNLVLAIFVAITPLWASAGSGWLITMGILIAIGALWALATASSQASEWVTLILGIVLFVAPWLGGFSAAGVSAWTAWIVGVLVVIFAAVGMNQAKQRTVTV